MKKITHFDPSLAKKLLFESKELITNGFLCFDEKWKDVKFSSRIHPKYLIFLVNPNNQRFKEHVYQQEGASQTWFEKEMENIAKSKEGIKEYFHYYSNFEFRIQKKLNDSTLFERWSTYPEHYILYLKAWNGKDYEPAALNAVAVKKLCSGSKKIGYNGSTWVSKQYRPDPDVKYKLWLLHLALCHQLNITSEYGYVLDANVKSLGWVAKTGMAPCQYKLSEIAVPLEIEKKDIKGDSFQRIESFESYEKIIRERFRDGMVYENLREFYDSQYFMGMYFNDSMDFQIWKGRNSTILSTQEQLQTYLIFNISNNNNGNNTNILENMVNQLRFNIMPSVHQSNEKILLIFFFPDNNMKEWMIQTFSDNTGIAAVDLTLVLQNISMLFNSESKEHAEMDYYYNNQVGLRNFFDPRDLASGVLFWNSSKLQNTEPSS